MGLEPTIFASGGQRVIHFATGSRKQIYKNPCIIYIINCHINFFFFLYNAISFSFFLFLFLFFLKKKKIKVKNKIKYIIYFFYYLV